MKKSSYITILFILLLQAGGLLFLLNAQRGFVQYKMSNVVLKENANFEKLILSKSTYQDSRINSKEISLAGKMFDVKSVLIEKDSVKLVVINDSKEENIVKIINNLLNATDIPCSQLPNQLYKLISLIYISPDFSYAFSIPSFHLFLFHHFNSDVVFQNGDILAPPPKFL